MKAFRIIFSTLIAVFVNHAAAQDFFSKEAPESLFDVGVRVGINTSNRTFKKDAFDIWNVNSWGTGIDLGCVVDLNIRDYISLQPGIFFESRSGDYAYSQNYFTALGETDVFTQLGHDRFYNINIPLLVSFKFNLAESVRLIAEAGPYFQYFFKDSASHKIQVIRPQTSPTDQIDIYNEVANKYDIGLKIGAGILYKRHYSFNIHYLAGGRKAWDSPWKGGRHKAWTFTIGYTL